MEAPHDSQNHAARGAPAAPGDLAYQAAILQDVSRTFALTIPRLPGRLVTVVGNAYLLCRIADTIEDSDALPLDRKRAAYGEFVAAVRDGSSPDAFARDLPPLLTGSTTDAERDLIAHAPAVVRVTYSFRPREREALVRCLRIMSEGMEEFQEGLFRHGLRDLDHLDAYCYHVAGVVGEMLTELFCAHAPEIERNREALFALAASFGQGLQMTNILKDVWDDRDRGVCWLPQSMFESFGLRGLSRDTNSDPAFTKGLDALVGVALAHLRNALAYTLLIPRRERGIREFCLWAIGMAVLTLRRVHENPAFTSGDQVKIPRRSVNRVIVATRVCGRSNAMLRALFNLAARGLPRYTTDGRPLDGAPGTDCG